MAMLSGKHCLVTGGSRGLGRALTLAFARAGAEVAFTFCKRSEDAQRTLELLAAEGHSALHFQGSVADAAHVRATVDALVKAWGTIDVLVNNAGITQVLPIALLDEPDWDQVMDVNCKGAYLFSRAVLKSMLKAKSGHILNIGSFGAERVVQAPAHYAASKAALRGLTDALAAEVGRYGISVNYLAPGLLNDGLAKRLPQHRINDYVSQSALRRVGTVEEVAALATFLVSPENSFMSGAKVVIDGGL